MRGKPRLWVLAGVVPAVVVLVLATAPAAWAHALLKSSSPSSGELLQSPPTRVSITFTQPPDPSLSVVHVLDSTGGEVETGPAKPLPGEPTALEVPVPRLADGVYTVTWRVVSKTDGHVTAGSFSFGVGVSPASGKLPPATGGATSPSPQPLAVAGRWLLYIGLAVLLGAVTGGIFVSRTMPSRYRVVLLLGWLAAVAGVAAMALSERSLIGVSWSQFLHSTTGHDMLARAAAVLVVGAGAAFAWLRRRWTALLPLGLAVLGAMLVHVYAGHAAAPGGLRLFDIASQWIHLAAVGVWIGGLVWLLALVRTPGIERGRVVKRFSLMAGFGLAAVALTGVFRALDEVGGPVHWRRLFDTSYGVTLVVKVALFGILVVLAWRNHYANVPAVEAGRDRGTLRRTVVAEVVVAALILGVTGVLSELPPAASLAGVSTVPARPAAVVVTGSDFATTVKVRLTATPGTVGPNDFQASVTDYDTGRPVPAKNVSLMFSLPGRPDIGSPVVTLKQGRAGVWTGHSTVLSIDGRWAVTAVVQEAVTAVEVPMRLQTRLPPEQITVSRAKGQPTVYTIALPNGRSLQTYIDPGNIGPNTVHFTYFMQSGKEQPVASAEATAITPQGRTERLHLIRFDPGHFAANTNLSAGRWRFQVTGSTSSGQSLMGYFSQRIEGGSP